MGQLDGKVAVVTGAGRGVGRAVAEAFAAEGAAVGLAARSQDEIEQVAAAIRSREGRALPVQTDVASQADVDRLFDQVRSELGSVEILINNAGLLGPIDHVWETDSAAWLEALDVNVVGCVRCIQAVLPAMITRRYGKIINVGSDAGHSDYWAATNFEHTAYAASKAAVRRMSEVVAEQVRKYGINVNCVGVSADTDMSNAARRELARVRGEQTNDSFEAGIAPDENTGTFVFLASPAADHITGQYFEANRLRTHMRQAGDPP